MAAPVYQMWGNYPHGYYGEDNNRLRFFAFSYPSEGELDIAAAVYQVNDVVRLLRTNNTTHEIKDRNDRYAEMHFPSGNHFVLGYSVNDDIFGFMLTIPGGPTVLTFGGNSYQNGGWLRLPFTAGYLRVFLQIGNGAGYVQWQVNYDYNPQ